MGKRVDILARFRNMSLQKIRNLSPVEKNNYLAALHAHLNQSPQDKMTTHKGIEKQKRQVSYKGFVRSHMQAIIDRANARVRHSVVQLRPRTKNADRGRSERFEKNVRVMAAEGGREQLNCSICLETLIRPVLISCGHTFCYKCLDEALLFSNLCPNCRETIRAHEFVPCALLDNLICATAGPQKSPALVAYRQQVRRDREWQRRREIDVSQLRVGTVLDVRDTENIWCQGTILQVEMGQSGPVSVLVHFNRWHKIYNQIIELPSPRLAPLTHYSSRTDIHRYKLALPDDNVRGLVVIGQPQDPDAIEVDSSSEEVENGQLNVAGVNGGNGGMRGNIDWQAMFNIHINVDQLFEDQHLQEEQQQQEQQSEQQQEQEEEQQEEMEEDENQQE